MREREGETPTSPKANRGKEDKADTEEKTTKEYSTGQEIKASRKNQTEPT